MPAEYLAPGVYIEEVNTGPRPIEGVGTAVAAFVGFAPYGKANAPVLVTNWTQYVREFGTPRDADGVETGPPDPHRDGWYLSHAVYGYFLNGGGRCYVTRVVAGSANGKPAGPASARIPARGAPDAPALVVTARESSGGPLKVEVAPPTGEPPPEGAFTLKVSGGARPEVFDNVTLSKAGLDEVNKKSKLVTVAEAPGATAERLPELGVFALEAPAPLSGGKLQTTDLVGSAAERTGVAGLEIAENVTMVCCPDLMAAYQQGMIDRAGVKAVQTAMIAHCERAADRVAILDPLPDMKPQEVDSWRMNDVNYDSMFAALYYPWLTVMGPAGKPIAVPPCGHMAGIWARNDNERGVHKAPANEVVRGARRLEFPVSKGMQDTLNPRGVNCIRDFRADGRGIRVWGARTMSSDSEWKYVNVRRLFIFVEESIDQGTQWVVFEPNDQNTWARVVRSITGFLTTVWRSGALMGATQDEAFFVKCDRTTMTQDDIDNGRLICYIGIAPVKPAEFVIFRISQKTAEAPA